MKHKSDIWFYISLSLILFILIFFIFYYKNPYTIIQHIPNQPIIIKENQDLPLYPKQDPIYFSEDFQQIGTLTSLDIDNPIILPLFGKKINNDRWLYYSASEKNNQLKVDIEYQNKKCNDKRIGCNELYTDDKIIIPAYHNKEFIVSKYDYKQIQYI